MWLQKYSQLINKSNLNRLLDYYAGEDNWHEIDKKSGNLGYGWFHYGMIRMLKPKRVLCIGSKRGFIPAVCALACRDNDFGVVDFVDAGFDQTTGEPNHWGGIGLWKRIDKDKYFRPFGLNKFINLYVMTSTKYKNLYPKRVYGYMHVDGDHSFYGVSQDFKLFWPALSSGGIMAFHDIYTQNLGGLNYGVSKFWDKIKATYRFAELPGECGLGVIFK